MVSLIIVLYPTVCLSAHTFICLSVRPSFLLFFCPYSLPFLPFCLPPVSHPSLPAVHPSSCPSVCPVFQMTNRVQGSWTIFKGLVDVVVGSESQLWPNNLLLFGALLSLCPFFYLPVCPSFLSYLPSFLPTALSVVLFFFVPFYIFAVFSLFLYLFPLFLPFFLTSFPISLSLFSLIFQLSVAWPFLLCPSISFPSSFHPLCLFHFPFSTLYLMFTGTMIHA